MEKLNDYILAKAIENNICQSWAEKIAVTESPDELMQMYVAGIDFCLSNNFPSNEDLQRLAHDEINRYGVYVDAAVRLQDRPFIVLLGKCTGQVQCTGYSVSKLHVKHDSTLKVVLQDNTYVSIDCLDNCNVDIVCNGNARAYVSVYSKAKVTTSGSGKVEIIHKHKETY